MRVSPIPEGYSSVTPYIFIRGAEAAIEFYQRAFGAEAVMRLPAPDGSLMHAEIRIGNAHVMLADEMPDMQAKSPQTLGGVSGSLMIYVDDVDATFAQALAAGATELRPIEDQFWGDRMGTVIDPFGQQWSIATHTEDVSEAEVQARFAEILKQMHNGEI